MNDVHLMPRTPLSAIDGLMSKQVQPRKASPVCQGPVLGHLYKGSSVWIWELQKAAEPHWPWALPCIRKRLSATPITNPRDSQIFPPHHGLRPNTTSEGTGLTPFQRSHENPDNVRNTAGIAKSEPSHRSLAAHGV